MTRPAETDFALLLRRFLTAHLPSVRGCSPGTVDSYRQAFRLLLEYLDEVAGVPADRVSMADLTKGRVEGFLGWLEAARGNSASTRNQRKAAVDSFVRFAMYERPEPLAQCQSVLSIPQKRAPAPEVSYLKTEGVAALMSKVDVGRRDGLRDFAMLSVMYTTGVRVSEPCGARVRDLSLGEPPTLLVHGKGGRSRYVPVVSKIVPILRDYLRGYGLDLPGRGEEWLFRNHAGAKLTRQGVAYIVRKYGDAARADLPSAVPADLSPHKLRHTAAMELVGSGVDLIYIRDLLGHASVQTMEAYARADSKMKREAIEAAGRLVVPREEACRDRDEGLRSWLRSFGRKGR